MIDEYLSQRSEVDQAQSEGATSPSASRKGGDAVEVGVGRNIQVGWRIRDLFEDVDFTEVE